MLQYMSRRPLFSISVALQVHRGVFEDPMIRCSAVSLGYHAAVDSEKS